MNSDFFDKKTYVDFLADIKNTKELTGDEDLYTDIRYIDGEKLEYEIMFGNDKIVFIKAGAGGSARGYEDKYRKMARRIHERSGATVICASNPYVSHKEFDEAEIRWLIAEKNLSDFEISFIGVSDGAYHNLSLVSRFSIQILLFLLCIVDFRYISL